MPAELGSVELAGQVITGNSVSVMVTVNEQVAVLPLASEMRKVLVVIPIGNMVPDACPEVWVTTEPGQLSEEVTT